MSAGLIVAAVLGLSAGLSPGPMLALVISESMRHGIGAGLRVAVAPLLTDGPIVLLVGVPFWLITDPAPLIAFLGLLGGTYLAYLAVTSLRARVSDLPDPHQVSGALRRGVVANLLNPNPYLFWLSIGLPTVTRLAADSGPAAVGFVVVFYIGLVGSKMLLAWLTGRGRRFFRPALYLWTLRVLGMALLFYAFLFVRQGLGWMLGAMGA